MVVVGAAWTSVLILRYRDPYVAGRARRVLKTTLVDVWLASSPYFTSNGSSMTMMLVHRCSSIAAQP